MSNASKSFRFKQNYDVAISFTTTTVTLQTHKVRLDAIGMT